MISDTIQFNNVIYTYPDGNFTLSVSGLSLKADEITFVTGDNGSGKTTLAKLMTGIIKPLKGDITLMGAPLSALSFGEIGKRIGYLWQNPGKQIFAQSVIEELTFAGELKNPKMTQAEKEATTTAALNWLEYFELAHLKDRTCFYLSQGEKQRLALAAVIASGATYLVLDEPTKGLDSKRKKILEDTINKLKDEKKIGMCIISHDDKFKEALCERVITLSKGELADG